jgi:hypothetical protein
MANSLWQHWLLKWRNDAPGLDPQVLSYVNRSYPSNHDFSIRGQRLVPHRQLARRGSILSRHYPRPLTDLLDLSCSKGFFVLAAAQQPQCDRALGIDIFEHDVTVSRTLAEYLQLPKARFEKLRLHELSGSIGDFGGPFSTVLLVNTYQYLFFGSDRAADCYLDHDHIFHLIRQVCSGRLIFNNRTELKDCQNQEAVARAGERAKEYETAKLIAAAGLYFKLVTKEVLGRYPLLVFEAK